MFYGCCTVLFLPNCSWQELAIQLWFDMYYRVSYIEFCQYSYAPLASASGSAIGCHTVIFFFSFYLLLGIHYQIMHLMPRCVLYLFFIFCFLYVALSLMNPLSKFSWPLCVIKMFSWMWCLLVGRHKWLITGVLSSRLSSCLVSPLTPLLILMRMTNFDLYRPNPVPVGGHIFSFSQFGLDLTPTLRYSSTSAR